MAIRAHPVNERIDRTLSKRLPEPTPVPEIERPAVDLAKILQRTTLAPNSLRPADLLLLQRTLGNRAVGALLARSAASPPLIQAKLTVTAPGDEYEREADRVALRREEQVSTSPREPLSPSVQRQHRRENENTTGLPDHLKAGIETLSGLSLDDVKVHYNSSKPAHVEALAYTQGTDTHVDPGQEKHLAHEAWHVVQQKQGRVRPTLQMRNGIAINDDAGLEKEADVMGTKALQMRRPDHIATDSAAQTATAVQRAGETRNASAVAGAAIGSPEQKVRLNFLSTIPASGGTNMQRDTNMQRCDNHRSHLDSAHPTKSRRPYDASDAALALQQLFRASVRGISSASVLHLHRLVGNNTVTALLASKTLPQSIAFTDCLGHINRNV